MKELLAIGMSPYEIEDGTVYELEFPHCGVQFCTSVVASDVPMEILICDLQGNIRKKVSKLVGFMLIQSLRELETEMEALHSKVEKILE